LKILQNKIAIHLDVKKKRKKERKEKKQTNKEKIDNSASRPRWVTIYDYGKVQF